MTLKRRIRVLYVQVLAGGGSLIALYEMLRMLDISTVEPLVLCYYKNRYTEKLETLSNVRVMYLSDTFPKQVTETLVAKKNSKLTGYLLAQIAAVDKFFFMDKSLRKKMTALIIEINPHILHHNNDVRIDRDVIRAAASIGISQIIHTRSLTSYRFSPVDYIIDFFLIRKASSGIYITETVNKYYERLFHLSPRNSLVLHDFVDTRKFKPSFGEPRLKKEFGIKEGEIVISNIGRITAWKGQHILIEAVNIIKHESPGLKVLIIGPYEKGVGSKEYYNYLQALTANYGLENIVLFTGYREDIAALMNISDIIVHTAVKPEPQGLMIIEALLCKKKIIATNHGGAAEIVKKYGGQLVKPGDVQELAALLIKLIKGEESETGHYPMNYEKLLNDFDGKKQMKKIEAIYDRTRIG